MTTPQHIVTILRKHFDDLPLTEQEIIDLQQWHDSGEADRTLFTDEDWAHIVRYAALRRDKAWQDAGLQQFKTRRAAVNQPLSADDETSAVAITDETTEYSPLKADTQRPAHRVHFLRKWGWAAAILLLVGAGAYLYTTTFTQPEPDLVKNNELPVDDVLPGSDKAILTLSDGSTITLNSAASGAIAQQGNASIIKDANGEIRYDAKGTATSEVMINIMSTPRGGQYKLLLPDGTKVWLNAASSIRYPAVFTGVERKVKVTGEVYMEVEQNKTKPFIVDIDGKATVQVLGTSFNINAYDDEGNIKTTLVEGSVKVNNKASLTPGKQAVIPNSDPDSINVTSANLEQTLAWKNGIFDFTNADFTAVMRQLERWYDIDIKYEGALPAFRTQGQVDRGVKLSGMLRFLNNFGVNTRLENRTLIISTN